MEISPMILLVLPLAIFCLALFEYFFGGFIERLFKKDEVHNENET